MLKLIIHTRVFDLEYKSCKIKSNIWQFYLVIEGNNISHKMNISWYFYFQGQIRHVRARKKVAKTVLAFVLMFAVCFLPHHVFMLWFYNYPRSTDEYNTFWHVLRIVGFCLSFVNSCINPIALYLVSGTFRKYFDKHLFWWCIRPAARVAAAAITESMFTIRRNGTVSRDPRFVTESTSLQVVERKKKIREPFTREFVVQRFQIPTVVVHSDGVI